MLNFSCSQMWNSSLAVDSPYGTNFRHDPVWDVEIASFSLIKGNFSLSVPSSNISQCDEHFLVMVPVFSFFWWISLSASFIHILIYPAWVLLTHWRQAPFWIDPNVLGRLLLVQLNLNRSHCAWTSSCTVQCLFEFRRLCVLPKKLFLCKIFVRIRFLQL